MNGNAVMELLETNLAAAMPTRVVTRTAMDFANRPKADMEKGVLTMIALSVDDLNSPPDLADYAGKLKIVLVGEFCLADDKALGEDIEAAEWALWEEIKTFIKAPGAGLCPLDATRLQLSGQVDAPFGWIAVDLEYSQLD